jgi:hypothetical protein
MSVQTKSGRVLTDADLADLAAKAEVGFDPSRWTQRRGRPSLGGTPGERSPRIATRISEEVRAKVIARAKAEGKSVSQVQRELLEDYARSAGPQR